MKKIDVFNGLSIRRRNARAWRKSMSVRKKRRGLHSFVFTTIREWSPRQRFTDKFEKYFVPSVPALVVVLNFAFLVIDEHFSESFYRAMAVLAIPGHALFC